VPGPIVSNARGVEYHRRWGVVSCNRDVVYLPHFNRMDEADVAGFLDAVGAADVVTTDADGHPVATLMPFVREHDRLLLHMARANQHWRAIQGPVPALAIVNGPQAYVSPSWYAAKREHGRVVPTWNYSSVHLAGTVTIHDDVAWLRDLVTRLTDLHETDRPERWAVSDAPATYIEKQLKAIVGVEFRVDRIEAKSKLSQNRSDEDRAGVIAGLEAGGVARDLEVARAMRSAEPS
jgi:transcriptional regulator